MLIDKHGKKDLELETKKVKNFKFDLNQFNRYKAALGEKNLPKTFDGFQNMKYKEPEKYEELRREYMSIARSR